MAVYYGYKAILGSQSTANGNPIDYAYAPPAGQAWSWTGNSTWFHVRETDGATQYNGDPTNEQISAQEQFGGFGEQLAYVDGSYYQTIWDYTFTVSDGTNTWHVGVVDIDFDSSDTISGTTENGYFLIFPDGIPPAGGSYTIGGISENADYTSHAGLGASVVCFAAGTLIETATGPAPVETLQAGDLVMTRDRGLQPLRWTGSRRVAATGSLAPIVFRRGAIGNRRRLVVSPQHRMLIADWRAELLFGQPSVLVKAKDLVDGEKVLRAEGGQVSYHHILFDRHEIVYAEGVPSESFQPGALSLDALEAGCAAELLALFPDLPANPEAAGAAARMSLRRHEAACLLAA